VGADMTLLDNGVAKRLSLPTVSCDVII